VRGGGLSKVRHTLSLVSLGLGVLMIAVTLASGGFSFSIGLVVGTLLVVNGGVRLLMKKE